MVHEIVRFLKADTPFMNMRPLRYSFAFDPHPDSLSSVASCDTKRRLRDAILSSYCHSGEVSYSFHYDPFLLSLFYFNDFISTLCSEIHIIVVYGN